jgi:hypothetical protein
MLARAQFRADIVIVIDKTKNRAGRRKEAPPAGAVLIALSDQVQVMRPFADDEQVLEVSECVAAAVQLAGGPVTAVAVTVTFCEGEKPCADPLPEKYTPELSAAYDSS